MKELIRPFIILWRYYWHYPRTWKKGGYEKEEMTAKYWNGD